MLCVLDKYHQFEYVLLQDSVRFFAAEGAQLVNVYDTARFLALVDRRLQVGQHQLCVSYSYSIADCCVAGVFERACFIYVSPLFCVSTRIFLRSSFV
jgi:glutathione S-transferase